MRAYLEEYTFDPLNDLVISLKYSTVLNMLAADYEHRRRGREMSRGRRYS